MQQLLEQSLHSDSWSPVKIKFNWDASYWTKQMSSLGKTYIIEGRQLYDSLAHSISIFKVRSLKNYIADPSLLVQTVVNLVISSVKCFPAPK